MAGLPQSVKDLCEMSPMEDVILVILRAAFPPEVPVQTLISEDQTFPAILVRRSPTFNGGGGDPRFTDAGELAINCFVQDPNGDEDAALLSEAVRVVLRDAWLDQTVVPNRGHISFLEMTSPPRRSPDWATATGPVQYADLPTGVHRYETRFRVVIRKPSALSI